MAFKKIEMSLALVLVTMLLGRATTQSSCISTLTSLAPCLSYVTGKSSTPSSSCCSQLSIIVQSSPQCLCSLLNGGGSTLGITINQTLALSLPGACNVKTPPVSRCQSAGGPATYSNNQRPADANTPEASTRDIPAGGSKTVPSTGGASTSDVGSSGGIKAPLHFVLFLIFVVSYASRLDKF
ncbi:non-specific lipid transfer protein GPI-anchored 5-like [Argentina anserina]|uniref:non-specific lipid transfer protein GPI-anchored 5-like n=1 Tax=Argentina anserina TaxID=57926 RepID=UPI0021768FDA|nr:non-specific lipid transfer protein GPI-anchored 5-like [Potentilla anserina]